MDDDADWKHGDRHQSVGPAYSFEVWGGNGHVLIRYQEQTESSPLATLVHARIHLTGLIDQEMARSRATGVALAESLRRRDREKS